jgi:hypothetical protein
MQNCYEFCFGIAKHIYNLFIFLSCRTPPLIEEETKHHECYKNGVKYCKMCDLDDFVMEESQPSQPLEKVEKKQNFDFVFSPPFPPFYSPFFNKNTVHH